MCAINVSFRFYSKYESTLPIVLTVILSVILIILIIIRLVQLLQQKRAKRIEKKAKERGKALEENPEEGRGGAERSTAAEEGKKKRKKTTTWSKKAKKQETQVGEEDALIVPANENGSLLQSGVRAHPTRKVENKSWYDSKVIPFIDETDQSLDNLYLPEKVTYEAV